MNPEEQINQPSPELSNDGKNKEKILVLIGAIVVIAAIFYFFFYKSNSVSQLNTTEVQAKLIDQTIKVISGMVAGIDADKKTFSLYTPDGQTHNVAVLPQTVIIGLSALDPKQVTTGESISMNKFKRGLNLGIDYIDAEKEAGLLYAFIIEKIE